MNNLYKNINKNKIKESRWDRIRKKHLNNFNVTTEIVKKFLNVNFINDKQMQFLNGTPHHHHHNHHDQNVIEKNYQCQLDPLIVMNIRHELIKRKSKINETNDQKPLDLVKLNQLEKLKNHNKSLELNLIDKELIKFKNEISKLQSESGSSTASRKMAEMRTRKRTSKAKIINDKAAFQCLNNKELFTSLKQSEECTINFYKALMSAPLESCNIFRSSSSASSSSSSSASDQKMNGNSINDKSGELLEGTTTTIIKSEKIDKSQPQSVRFGDHVEVITYSKETSLMSNDNIDDTESCDDDSLIDEVDFFGLDESEVDPNNTRRRHRNFDENQQNNCDKIITYCQQTTTTTTSSIVATIHNHSFPNYDSDGRRTEDEDESQSIISSNSESESEWLEKPVNTETNVSKEIEESLSKNNATENHLVITKITLDRSKSDNKSCDIEKSTDSQLQNKNVDMSPEKMKIISELFEDQQTANKEYKNLVIKKKYFLKWIHFTTLEKIKNHDNFTSKDDRIKKIDAFLTKVREEKKKYPKNWDSQKTERGKIITKPKTEVENSIILAKKYHNKLKIQQDIIEMQKMKLERQERLIAELRLLKLSEAARESKNDLKNELKQVIKTGDMRLRAKAKCLQLVANLRNDHDHDGDDVDDELRKLAAHGSIIPRFLAQMQERTIERNVRHERAKERREQLERQKEEVKSAMEEEKRREDEEAKRLRIEALREKRRQEKLQKLQKEQERQKWLANNKKANEFYRILLLRRYGMDRFKKLIVRKKLFELKARKYRRALKMKYCFKHWRTYTATIWQEKHQKAETFHKVYCQRIAMRLWKGYHLYEQGKLLVAIDWYEMRLSERYFLFWAAKSRQAKIVEEHKFHHAEAHYNWYLKWHCIERWQRLHAILKLEKETEERRQRWRLKVWELLPDYKPNIED